MMSEHGGSHHLSERRASEFPGRLLKAAARHPSVSRRSTIPPSPKPMRAGRRFTTSPFPRPCGPAAKSLPPSASRHKGALVLDVGVGTGLELPMFDPSCRVVGIDLSEPMLRRAARRTATGALHHVAGLSAMDACRLAFADATFDVIVAPYVLTVLPRPEASLDEWVRVLKPGGEIVLVNHIGATSGPLAWVEVQARRTQRRARLAAGVSLAHLGRLARRACRPAPH